MKLLAVFWASAAAIAACCVPPVSAFWRLNCPTPVTVQRADSIVSPGKPASHIHTVVGSSGFHASSTPASIRRAACSTCEVADDMSNYWVPNVYYQRQDGGFEYVTGGGILVYYLQRRATDAEVLRAFPDNLVMIAGDPKRTTYNASKLEDRAISFMCLNYANPNPEQHQWYTDRDCPQGLRAQIFFPSCWDGVNVDSADHKSHMSYPDGVDNGKCPPTHPVRLISIFFEIFFDITRYKDGWLRSDGTPFRSWPFLFSTGDRTGNSLHGDFMNGWNSGVLQQAIDNCTDLSGDIRKCGAFTFRPDGFDRTCQLDTPVVLPDEQVFGVLWDMPAHPELRNGAPRPAGPVQLGCYDDPAAPNRWVPAAQRLAQTNDMTPTKCIALAKEKNYTYAGLEYGTECYGGNTLPKAKLSGCNARCPGSTTDIEFCGGSNSLTLWQVTGPGTGPTVAPIDNNNQAGAAAAGACASNAVAIALTALIATVMKYTN